MRAPRSRTHAYTSVHRGDVARDSERERDRERERERERREIKNR